ncbi:transposase [Chromobacterium violaceum]|uniref:transposase n=1 Tax=Chromobacterium violaceum TaxID=536 RepID=UPI00349FA4AD
MLWGGHIIPNDPASCAHLALRQRCKLHLGIDAQALTIRAMDVTGDRTGNATMLPARLSRIAAIEALATVTTDGAYDSYLCHAAFVGRGAAAIIFYLSAATTRLPLPTICPASSAYGREPQCTKAA